MRCPVKCELYKLIFKLVPINWFRARIMGKHLSQCPRCSAEQGRDLDFKEILNPPREWLARQDLWPGIGQEIVKLSRQEKKQPWRVWGLKPVQWAYASLVLLVLAFVLPYLLNLGAPAESLEKKKEIIIRSIKVENKPAKGYYFKSTDKDKLFVWVQKT